jgi:hypothetical protein
VPYRANEARDRRLAHAPRRHCECESLDCDEQVVFTILVRPSPNIDRLSGSIPPYNLPSVVSHYNSALILENFILQQFAAEYREVDCWAVPLDTGGFLFCRFEVSDN